MRKCFKNDPLKKGLLWIDLFSPHFEFEVRRRETRYATQTGGLYTLTIMLTVLVYGAIRMDEWFNNKLEPNVNFYKYSPTEKMSVDISSLNITF